MGIDTLPHPLRIGVKTHPQPDLSSPYFSACFAGLATVFGQPALIVNPTSLAVDGWVLLAPDAAQVDAVRKDGQPAVIVNGAAEGLPSVDLDNVGAAREVTVHLAAQGHRRIGFIAGKLETANARDRQEGYRRGLEEQGIPWDPKLTLDGRFERAGGRKAMAQFLGMASPPTAVFAANDHMALGAWDVLKEKKIAVPDNVALAGFDDIPEANTAGLTSVRQPLTDMATQAGCLLLNWIRTSQREGKGILCVNGTLIHRFSSGTTKK